MQSCYATGSRTASGNRPIRKSGQVLVRTLSAGPLDFPGPFGGMSGVLNLLIHFAPAVPSNPPESPPLPPDLPLGWVATEDQGSLSRTHPPGFQPPMGARRINNLFIDLEGKIPTEPPELPPKLQLDLKPLKEALNGTRPLMAGPIRVNRPGIPGGSIT
jgi:hypothetical protein